MSRDPWESVPELQLQTVSERKHSAKLRSTLSSNGSAGVPPASSAKRERSLGARASRPPRARSASGPGSAGVPPASSAKRERSLERGRPARRERSASKAYELSELRDCAPLGALKRARRPRSQALPGLALTVTIGQAYKHKWKTW